MKYNKIRILDLRDSPWLDGPGRTILQCAEDICKDKFEIIIGAFSSHRDDGTPYEQEARKKGLRVIRIREKKTFDIRPLNQILYIIDNLRIDIVHTHDFRSNVMGICAAKLSKRAVISTVHGWISNNRIAKFKTILDKYIVRQSDHVIAVSGATLKLLGKNIHKTNYSIIPNALRTEQYHPKKNVGKFRNQLGIDNNKVMIAIVGRLSPEKGQDLLIRAAREIVFKNKKIRFLFIGIGPDKHRLLTMIQEMGLSEYFVFTGYLNDMISAYNDIDLTVQTSWTEGMPNVILESLIMEVPVIATDVGGTSEILSDGKTGILIPPGDYRSLAFQIQKFIENPTILKNMAKQGSHDIRTKFNHSDRVKKIQDVYLKVNLFHKKKSWTQE